MKKFRSRILFLLVLTAALCAQDKKEVTIKVQAPNLQQGSVIYVTGNNDDLGNWNPAAVPLKMLKDSIWTKTFKFSKGKIVEFKITRGSWDKERLNDNGSVPSNTVLKVTSDTTIYFVVNKWADQFERKITAHGQITGDVEYIKGLEGDGILPRDIIIWLPPGYEKNKEERYPVLYMHDGQNIIDPATSSFGYDWQVDEAADSLIKARIIKKIIIVGIYSTADRNLDYGGAKSDDYMKFVVKKLKPLIDKKYRTKPGRKNTAIAGSSLGGLISFMMLWKYPDVFSEGACISPAFHIEKYNCLPMVEKTKSKKPVRIYIDNGGVGLEEKLQPGVDEMLALLKEKGYKEGEDLEYFKDADAEHNERFWAKRVWRPLEFLFAR